MEHAQTLNVLKRGDDEPGAECCTQNEKTNDTKTSCNHDIVSKEPQHSFKSENAPQGHQLNSGNPGTPSLFFDKDTEHVIKDDGSVTTDRLNRTTSTSCLKSRSLRDHLCDSICWREQSPVIRSRCKKTPLFQPKDARCNKVQLQHVPQSRDEQLTRLKSACHCAWINYLNECPSIINNNVKGNGTSAVLADDNRVVRCMDTINKTHNKVNVQRMDKSTTPLQSSKDLQSSANSERLLNLYKFLNFIVSVVILFLKIVVVAFLIIFILYCLMVLHKPTQAFVSRHTQDLIYPFMRAIRFGSLPILHKFPQLYELYEDACLLGNPFFEMNDVSCWPCESVRHVIDLTGFSNFTTGSYHSGIPFIVKDSFTSNVKIEDIYGMYMKDEKLIGTALIKSSSPEIKTLDDLMKYNVKPGNFYSGNLHVVWKINRVQFARLMRKTFSKPYYIPNTTEVSVQQFLFIDEPAAEQYAFPVTEFANVFVMQADGRRLIVLVPVRHCRNACKAISVVLQSKDVLFYNWLFWRPISFPMKGEEGHDLSITYVGSFY